VTERAAFLEVLRQVRQVGFSVDRAESLRGVHCVAAPVMDERGWSVASICVTAPADRMPERDFPKVAKQMIDCTAAVSAKLGYHGGEGRKA
jgi:DNA-binding IclR family transcriptional regulator